MDQICFKTNDCLEVLDNQIKWKWGKNLPKLVECKKKMVLSAYVVVYGIECIYQKRLSFWKPEKRQIKFKISERNKIKSEKKHWN